MTGGHRRSVDRVRGLPEVVEAMSGDVSMERDLVSAVV